MRFILIVLILTLISYADSYLLNGGQLSMIDYAMVQKIYPDPGTQNVSVTIVEPRDFSSPTYNQTISGFQIETSVEPAEVQRLKDERGNPVLKYIWGPPLKPFDVRLSFRAQNRVILEPLNALSSFPLEKVDGAVAPFLAKVPGAMIRLVL